MLSHEHPRAAARRVETDDPDDLGPVSSTPELMVTRALEFADVTPEDVVYDLGLKTPAKLLKDAQDKEEILELLEKAKAHRAKKKEHQEVLD